MAGRIELHEYMGDGTLCRTCDARFGLVWGVMWEIEGGAPMFPLLNKISDSGTISFDDSAVPELRRELQQLKAGITNQQIKTEADRTIYFLDTKQGGTELRFVA